MALSLIQQVRLLIQDNNVSFPFLSDDEITYFLEKNSNNVNRSALDCAKVVLLQLSMRSTSETVDLFSISGGHRAAEQYRMALELFLRNPSLNPIYQGLNGYASGISVTDIQANIDNADNNAVITPLAEVAPSGTYFEL